ncbi:coiled-coil domain-containing protein [Flavobacterium nackdongense]|uniref:Uncharacterized protein n=1 Tax=Flavobacterium nackdongense TaxID=2547394 RepID=A0A4P6YDP4_9FLAO|nr:hypothetical protein [Flavobacterium nackdongense]QBN19004.1 hypothetical protein E1750_09375 [Flavobacterium nackdongense]
MLTLILAFLGFVLMGLSIYFFFNGSFDANEKVDLAEKELEKANKKIERLNQELSEKTRKIFESEKNIKNFTSEPFGHPKAHNIPVLEITSVDLGEGVTVEGNKKKVHRLMYSHQIRFIIMNIGKNALKDVIFSIKDVYNEPKEKGKTKKTKGELDFMNRPIDNEDIGSYDNIEIHTLNLKSKKLIYSSNLPSSFGFGNYCYDVIVEWADGSYQMQVEIEEIDGKLKFKYEFYNVNGEPIDLKKLTTVN